MSQRKKYGQGFAANKKYGQGDLLQTSLQHFLHIGICVKILGRHLSMTDLKKTSVKFLSLSLSLKKTSVKFLTLSHTLSLSLSLSLMEKIKMQNFLSFFKTPHQRSLAFLCSSHFSDTQPFHYNSKPQITASQTHFCQDIKTPQKPLPQPQNLSQTTTKTSAKLHRLHKLFKPITINFSNPLKFFT